MASASSFSAKIAFVFRRHSSRDQSLRRANRVEHFVNFVERGPRGFDAAFSSVVRHAISSGTFAAQPGACTLTDNALSLERTVTMVSSFTSSVASRAAAGCVSSRSTARFMARAAEPLVVTSVNDAVERVRGDVQHALPLAETFACQHFVD